MYKFRKPRKTTIRTNTTSEGETIEDKVGRITENKEPIKDGAPEIFTERSKGVEPGFNIRTDRWEIATEAMDAVHRSNKAKRENKANLKVVKDDKIEEKKIDGIEPIQGTEIK